MIRKSLFITKDLDQRLKSFCGVSGESESTILRLALDKFLVKKLKVENKGTDKQ